MWTTDTCQHGKKHKTVNGKDSQQFQHSCSLTLIVTETRKQGKEKLGSGFSYLYRFIFIFVFYCCIASYHKLGVKDNTNLLSHNFHGSGVSLTLAGSSAQHRTGLKSRCWLVLPSSRGLAGGGAASTLPCLGGRFPLLLAG